MADSDKHRGTPTVAQIAAVRDRLAPYIVETPVMHLRGPEVMHQFGAGTELYLKMETFQPTGSFKVRSVLAFLQSLAPERLQRGLVTLSAGNHAAAVAYAAQRLATSATVVMPKSTNPRKVDLSAQYGAEVVFVDDILAADATLREIEDRDGRLFVPAWGKRVLCLGTATIGLELLQQAPQLDAVVCAIGGGSVCAGIGPLLAAQLPDCEILAAEPAGAPTMLRSFQSGRVERLQAVNTIAEGLAPPVSCELFARICKQCVASLQPITDQQIVDAMRFLFAVAKSVVEPAGAGAMAGALGPFRERIAGRRCAVIVSGSNIDYASYDKLIKAFPAA